MVGSALRIRSGPVESGLGTQRLVVSEDTPLKPTANDELISTTYEDYGIAPQVFVRAPFVLVGLDTRVLIARPGDHSRTETLESPFYCFVSLPGDRGIIAVHEIGLVAWLNDDFGRPAWRYLSEDQIETWQVGPTWLDLQLVSGQSVRVGTHDGRRQTHP